MAIFKFSNAGGFGTYTRYNDFLAGNPAVIADKGSMYPIGVFTLAAAQASVVFDNIPQTYKHLQIRFIGKSTRSATDDDLRLTFNSSTGTYYRHELYGNGTNALSFSSSSTYIEVGYLLGNNSNSNSFGTGVIDILDYSNTNKNSVTKSLTGGLGLDRIKLMSGAWFNTAAVTSITLSAVNGNLQTKSSFALYGIQA